MIWLLRSLLIALSAAFLVITFFLANTSKKYDIMHKRSDALSFQAPHQQSDSPRRNLSEAEAGAEDGNAYYGGKQTSQMLTHQQLNPPPKVYQPQSSTKTNTQQLQVLSLSKEEKEKNNNRPTGVVYEYIHPPPINLEARALLSRQFPNLADINATTSAAICGIVKDAESYLDEWVDYHFGLGFHTIYLIDNSQDHELLNWQNKRRASGYSVRVMPKPGTHRQMYGFHMCAAEHKDDHTYMAFIDVDEFLVLKQHDTIDEFLSMHLPKGALAISWHIFGTGYTDNYTPLPVTKRFMYRDGVTTQDRHSVWHNVKSILKTSDYGGYPQSPHSMKTNKKTAGSDKAWIDTNGKGSFDKIGASNNDRPTDVAVIHHYKYLSPKEFYWKSCVRKTVDDKFKDCSKLKRTRPYTGKIYDDSAWVALKKNVPKYAMFDQFEDFM